MWLGKDASKPLIIFGEIHKHKGWKNYLKGVYDVFGSEYQFLVLGSGRLDQHQRGGDSLAGRYFLSNIWPFTLAELMDSPFPFEDFRSNPLSLRDQESAESREAWRKLEALSGFPEPFLSGKPDHFRRWERAYRKQVIREDIRDLTALRHIDSLEALYALLQDRVGSPLSMESLGRDPLDRLGPRRFFAALPAGQGEGRGGLPGGREESPPVPRGMQALRRTGGCRCSSSARRGGCRGYPEGAHRKPPLRSLIGSGWSGPASSLHRRGFACRP